MARKINLPLTEELAKTLKAGDEVLLTGTIYTSRDAGHKRMCESLAKGEPLPFDPMDATGYSNRLRRSYNLRQNGCLRSYYDVCRRSRYDW